MIKRALTTYLPSIIQLQQTMIRKVAMIDLAPHHKIGLTVKNPVLLAGGTIGYGEAIPAGLDLKGIGAVVVGPLQRQSAAGAAPPRLAELPGGFILATGLQNRGVNDVLKRFARQWARLGAPVIVQVADLHPQSLSFILERLLPVTAVAGIELALPPGVETERAKQAVQMAVQLSDLPVWVKLPMAEALLLAPVAVAAGAVGLVVSQPPLAAALRPNQDDAPPPVVQGSLYGPLAFHLMLPILLRVSKLGLPAALIACGGIHTTEQAHMVLNIPGVRALQVDRALWVEPGLPLRLAAACTP